jgi:hypothetical protein
VKKIKKLGIAGAVAVGAIAISTGVAGASSISAAPKPGNFTIVGCVAGSSRTLEHVFTDAANFKNCPSGSFAVAFNSTGPKGATGATGAKGATGAQGPSGVVGVTNQQLVTAPAGDPVATGGSFTTLKTLVGTVALKAAGTYEVNVNYTATPNAVTGGEVFPFLAVYDGAQKSDFSNDIFNVGSGALEQETTQLPAGDSINSNFSGSDVVTVPAGGETLDIYAFGNDSDQGQGSYVLNSATVNAVQLNTAS